MLDQRQSTQMHHGQQICAGRKAEAEAGAVLMLLRAALMAWQSAVALRLFAEVWTSPEAVGSCTGRCSDAAALPVCRSNARESWRWV